MGQGGRGRGGATGSWEGGLEQSRTQSLWPAPGCPCLDSASGPRAREPPPFSGAAQNRNWQPDLSMPASLLPLTSWGPQQALSCSMPQFLHKASGMVSGQLLFPQPTAKESGVPREQHLAQGHTALQPRRRPGSRALAPTPLTDPSCIFSGLHTWRQPEPQSRARWARLGPHSPQ